MTYIDGIFRIRYCYYDSNHILHYNLIETKTLNKNILKKFYGANKENEKSVEQLVEEAKLYTSISSRTA
jgi:hypothetical protein